MRTYADLSKNARTVSKSDTCCENCYYGGNEYMGCLCPFSDLTLERLHMDPCYEGALIHLAKKEALEDAENAIKP